MSKTKVRIDLLALCFQHPTLKYSISINIKFKKISFLHVISANHRLVSYVKNASVQHVFMRNGYKDKLSCFYFTGLYVIFSTPILRTSRNRVFRDLRNYNGTLTLRYIHTSLHSYFDTYTLHYTHTSIHSHFYTYTFQYTSIPLHFDTYTHIFHCG